MTGCGWLIEVPSGNPEPDSYSDTIKIVECGAPALPGKQLCEAHQPLLDMDDILFERWVEAKEKW